MHARAQAYWAREAAEYRFVPAREFAEAFARSEAGAAQAEALSQPFQQTALSDAGLTWTKHALSGAPLSAILYLSACRQVAQAKVADEVQKDEWLC